LRWLAKRELVRNPNTSKLVLFSIFILLFLILHRIVPYDNGCSLHLQRKEFRKMLTGIQRTDHRQTEPITHQ